MCEYSFPTLPIDDIVTNLPFVTEADLKKPEPVRWFNIYSKIFEYITEEKPENGEEKAMVMFPKYCQADNPEYYEDASRILWFTLSLQNLFNSCGISDFTFKDIRDPKPKRCTVLCSAVLNFMRFKADREPIIGQVLEKVERYKHQHAEIMKTNDELKKRISIEMAQHAERENRFEQLQEESGALRDNMAMLQAESQGLLAKISEKKMFISEARARRDDIKCQIVKVRQECEKLQLNIVQSPQKVKDKLRAMQEKVELLKQTKAEKIELVANRRKQLDELKTRNGIVDQGTRFMQSMLEDQDKIKSVQEEIKTIKESRQVNDHKSKGIQKQEEELLESISLIQDRIQKLHLQKRTRAADLDACFSQTNEKKKKTTTKVDARKAEKDSLQREKDIEIEKIEVIQGKCNDKANTILKEYADILESLDRYHILLREKTAACV